MAVSSFDNLRKPQESNMFVYSHGGKHHRVMPSTYLPATGEVVSPVPLDDEGVKKAFKESGYRHHEDNDYIDSTLDANAYHGNLEPVDDEKSKADEKLAEHRRSFGGVSGAFAEPVTVTTNATTSDHATILPEDGEITADREKKLSKSAHPHKKHPHKAKHKADDVEDEQDAETVEPAESIEPVDSSTDQE